MNKTSDAMKYTLYELFFPLMPMTKVIWNGSSSGAFLVIIITRPMLERDQNLPPTITHRPSEAYLRNMFSSHIHRYYKETF